jgi:AraC-like DNA-binding protein
MSLRFEPDETGMQMKNVEIEAAEPANGRPVGCGADRRVQPDHFGDGFAPIDFFIRLRMEQACELLDVTLSNVKEVAAALGYEDPFYFSRTFKAVTHVAPSEYRMMSREFKDAIRSAVLPGVISDRPGSSGDLRTSRWSAPSPGRMAIQAKQRAAGAASTPQWLVNAVH